MIRILCLLWLIAEQSHALRLVVGRNYFSFSRLFSTKSRGFGPSPGSSPQSSGPKKGFGGQPSGANKPVDPASSVRGNMETTIQMSIDAEDGLRECMNLKTELDDWAISLSAMNPTSRKTISTSALENIEAKKVRLAELERMHGWNENVVSKKLHELTWDASAQFRDERHQSMDISYEMETHMHKVVKAILEANNGQDGAVCGQPTVLDVGAGTGILMKFLLEYTSSSSSSNTPKTARYQQENLVGIDLSSEMIKICQSTYPRATYFQGDFLDYTGVPANLAVDPAAGGTKVDNKGTFDVVVFNESLHHFQDTCQALEKAISLTRSGGKIVISHPRGFDNVFLQQRKNKWLTPSLLPSEADLSSLAAQFSAAIDIPPKTKSAHYLAVLTKK